VQSFGLAGSKSHPYRTIISTCPNSAYLTRSRRSRPLAMRFRVKGGFIDIYPPTFSWKTYPPLGTFLVTICVGRFKAWLRIRSRESQSLAAHGIRGNQRDRPVGSSPFSNQYRPVGSENILRSDHRHGRCLVCMASISRSVHFKSFLLSAPPTYVHPQDIRLLRCEKHHPIGGVPHPRKAQVSAHDATLRVG
jgi:hypothetical protein